MSVRTINNPGVELNEIDRSGYDKVDNSLPNSPTSLIFGVADKGQDMSIEWINSKATLDETFGTPTTEFESYLYNAAIEILNRGGSCIAAKLPYDNKSYRYYNCIDLSVSELIQTNYRLSADTKYDTIGDIAQDIQNVYSQLEIPSPDTNTVNKMVDAIEYLEKNYLPKATIEEKNYISDLSSSLVNFITQYVNADNAFSYLYFNDSNLTSHLEIGLKPIDVLSPGKFGQKLSIDVLDDYLTSRRSVVKNTIRIVDMTRSQYDRVDNYDCVSCEQLSSYTNECLGIVPVVVTPANAMFFQNILNFSISELCGVNVDYSAYNSVSSFASMHHDGIVQDFTSVDMNVSLPIASTTAFESSPIFIDSVSRKAAQQFPLINFYDANHFDKTNLKKISIVVFKAFKDTSNGGKIGFQLLESFTGTLKKNSKDEITKASTFIDDVVNQNSQFIRVFSNVDQNRVEQATTYTTSRQKAVSMGFYKVDCAKNISYINSIMNPLTTLLDKAANRNIVPIDLFVDAGVSNIAQLAYNQKEKVLNTDLSPFIKDYDWPFNATMHDITGWRAVLQKLDNFCKSQRKDCLLLADGLRPMCLDGSVKLVRPTAPQNTTYNQVIPKFKYIAHAIDSSYAAGYCNWFLQQDYGRSGDYIWIPPSIKAAGACIYCDTYFHPWSAPAGTVRGVIGDAIDVAFLPTDDDAGVIYSNSWNYAMSYPLYGIVIEGHKTFQTQRTALDRINVRRLMLSLEKQVEQIARTFVYENNTAYMRQQFVDRVTIVLDSAVAGSGISDYAVKCDDELNTPQVIENNEMRCKIAVKPIKCVDYIVISFICTNQSVDVREEVLK